MGCCVSSSKADHAHQDTQLASFPRNARRVVWSAEKPMDRAELEAMRAEFWDTQPHYGGNTEIWATLKACMEQDDMAAMQAFLDAAEIKVADANLTSFYDSRGFLYQLPNYVVSDPRNLRH